MGNQAGPCGVCSEAYLCADHPSWAHCSVHGLKERLQPNAFSQVCIVSAIVAEAMEFEGQGATVLVHAHEHVTFWKSTSAGPTGSEESTMMTSKLFSAAS